MLGKKIQVILGNYIELMRWSEDTAALITIAKVETIQMSIMDEWIKKNVIYNGKLFSFKKE